MTKALWLALSKRSSLTEINNCDIQPTVLHGFGLIDSFLGPQPYQTDKKITASIQLAGRQCF